MAAPLKNRNHLKYPTEKVKLVFNRAIKEIKNDEEIFNYPSLHKSLQLKSSRTLTYLALKNKNNQELMKLWQDIKTGLDRNLQKKLQSHESKIEFA